MGSLSHRLTVHLRTLFRLLVSHRVDTNSQAMNQPALSLTWLCPLCSVHRLDDENNLDNSFTCWSDRDTPPA